MRPESLTLTATGRGHVQARVELVEALGAETLVYVSDGSAVPSWSRARARALRRSVGDAVEVEIDATARICSTRKARS